MNPSLPLSRGIVYVATGERYLAEAAESRAALKQSNPTLPAALVTDRDHPPGDWDRVLPFEGPVYGLRDKIAMRRSPWDLSLYLDTDTWVAMDVVHLFDLLQDGFDLIGHQLFEGHDYEMEGVSGAFPEFNTGVLGFRRSSAIDRFFDDWAAEYDRTLPLNANDQRSFRAALYRSGLRHSVIPPEYNFRPLSTNFAIMPLHIIHGRPFSDLRRLKAEMDVKFVHRAWVPRLGCVISDMMTPRQAWRLWLASTLELIRTGTRPARKKIRRIFLRD